MRKKNYFLEGDAAAAASGFEGFLTAIKGFGDSVFEGMSGLWETIKNFILKAIKFLFTGETTTVANPEYGMVTGFTNIFRSKGNEISATVTTSTPGFFLKEIGNIGSYAVTPLHLIAGAAILGVFIWGVYKLCSWLYKKFKKSEGYSVYVPTMNEMLSEAMFGGKLSFGFLKKMIGLGEKAAPKVEKMVSSPAVSAASPKLKVFSRISKFFEPISSVAKDLINFRSNGASLRDLEKRYQGVRAQLDRASKQNAKNLGRALRAERRADSAEARANRLSTGIKKTKDYISGLRSPGSSEFKLGNSSSKRKYGQTSKFGDLMADFNSGFNDFDMSGGDNMPGWPTTFDRPSRMHKGSKVPAGSKFRDVRKSSRRSRPMRLSEENSMLMDILSSAALQEAKMFSKKLRKTTSYSVADRNALAEAYYQESLANKLSYFLG
jgi:hypothetical protein